ncbi:MAG: murein biosynthesis integral membrane protein MurJ [Planctomycetota bacterium]|nr:MAG: murein biosynthesis integral membrane protein MurJ [Planctomycetota bacterium]
MSAAENPSPERRKAVAGERRAAEQRPAGDSGAIPGAAPRSDGGGPADTVDRALEVAAERGMAQPAETEERERPRADRSIGPRSDWASVRLVSACTVCSRILGLGRDAAMAAVFGNGPVLDAFTVAFRVPNLARRLFGEGALTAAFLPRFVRLLRDAGPPVAWGFATAVLRLLVLFLGLVTTIAVGTLVVVLRLKDLQAEWRLLLELTATMLPYVVLVCFVAVVSAVLHSLGRFVLPAVMPILLNLVWLLGLGTAVAYCAAPERIYVVAWSIVAAGVLQVTVAAWSLPRSVSWRWAVGPEIRAEVRAMLRALTPLLAGLSVLQVNALLDGLLAWALAEPSANGGGSASGSWRYPLEAGTASALYFAQRVFQFPLGVFGAALGTVVFPRLARLSAGGQEAAFGETLRWGIRQVIVVAVPASVGLMLVADELAMALFQRGAFDAADSRQTAGVLAMYGLSVWAGCALMVVHRAFYAVDDQWTPLAAGMRSVVLNAVLNVALVWPLRGMGLALATSVATIAQLLLVGHRAGRRFGALIDVGTWRTLWRTAVATVSMALVCVVLLRVLGGATTAGAAALRLAVVVPVGAIVYYAAARVLGVRDVDDLLRR